MIWPGFSSIWRIKRHASWVAANETFPVGVQRARPSLCTWFFALLCPCHISLIFIDLSRLPHPKLNLFVCRCVFPWTASIVSSVDRLVGYQLLVWFCRCRHKKVRVIWLRICSLKGYELPRSSLGPKPWIRMKYWIILFPRINHAACPGRNRVSALRVYHGILRPDPFGKIRIVTTLHGVDKEKQKPRKR